MRQTLCLICLAALAGCAGRSGAAGARAGTELSRVDDGVYNFQGSAGGQRSVSVQGQVVVDGFRVEMHPRDGTPCMDLTPPDRLHDPIAPAASFRCGEVGFTFRLRGPRLTGSFSTSVNETRTTRGECQVYSTDGRTCIQWRWIRETVQVPVGGSLSIRRVRDLEPA